MRVGRIEGQFERVAEGCRAVFEGVRPGRRFAVLALLARFEVAALEELRAER